MLTVKKVSEIAGISVRTLQYYDKIGLLTPSQRSESGYRLYSESDLSTLKQILLFRELDFPLSDIKNIMQSPGFDRKKALDRQIELLEIRREHLDNLITFARGIKMLGVKAVDFSAFNRSKLDEYAKRAKEEWGNTPEYKELAEHEKGRSPEETEKLTEQFMTLFAQLGEMKHLSADAPEVQEKVKKVQNFITENFYTCTDEIFAGLGKMYACGGEISENIDKVGGEGTAVFVSRAIDVYCGK